MGWHTANVKKAIRGWPFLDRQRVPVGGTYLAGVAGAAAGVVGAAAFSAFFASCFSLWAARLASRSAFLASCLAFMASASALCSACFSFAASVAFAAAGAAATAGVAGVAAGAWANAPKVEITRAVAIRDCFNIELFQCMATLPCVLNCPRHRGVYRPCVNLCKAGVRVPAAARSQRLNLPDAVMMDRST